MAASNDLSQGRAANCGLNGLATQLVLISIATLILMDLGQGIPAKDLTPSLFCSAKKTIATYWKIQEKKFYANTVMHT